jgi:2-polyprenyl-3-methyl-5-hydroxy-6-metoxy-1,4-benzoquinol methylase
MTAADAMPQGEQGQGSCALCGAPTASATVRWVKEGLAIVECRSCRLLYRRDLPEPDEVADIYREEYFRDDGALGGEGYRDYLSDEGEHRLNARRRLDRLERVSEKGTLLDVGCAAGFFLDEARRRGWTARGIDVAPSMTRYARDELGLDVETGLFQRTSLAAESVDCVTMWDYIEHSITPFDDLRAAHRVLRRGGTLALSTGDAGTLVARLSGRRWHLLTPRHHNFFFTTETLTRALEQAGFAVKTVGHPPAWYSVSYLAHKLQTLARVRPVTALSDWIATRPVGDKSVPVNLFDIVTIAAVAR